MASRNPRAVAVTFAVIVVIALAAVVIVGTMLGGRDGRPKGIAAIAGLPRTAPAMGPGRGPANPAPMPSPLPHGPG